jgi:protein tyrosine kinase modulator
MEHMAKPAESDTSFNDYLGALKRRGSLFFGIVAAIVLVGVAIAYKVPPLYASRGVLLAEQPGVSDRAVRSTVPTFPEERVRIVTQRVLTRDNLQRIIADNDLYPELAGMPAEQRGMFRDNVKLSGEDPEILENIMGTTRPAGATAFSVSFLDPSPVVARDVTNDLVELYLSENHEARREQAAETTRFLTAEVGRLEQELAKRDAAIADFKTANQGKLPELNSSNMQMRDRTERDLDAVENEIRSLREDQERYTSELAQLSPQATVLNDQGNAILSPSDRLKMLQRQYMQLSSIYSPDHPDVLKVRREIDALSASTGLPAFDRATLQSELGAARDELQAARDRYSNDHPDVLRLEKTVESLTAALASTPRSTPRTFQFQPDNPAYIQREVQLRGVSADLRAALERRDALRARLEDLQNNLTTSPEVEREYAALNRGKEQLYAQYSETQTKLHEAEMSLNLEQDANAERFTVLEQPSIAARPARPNRIAVLLLTFAIALVLGAAGVAFVERSDDTVRNAHDVTEFLEIPPLVAVPYVANPRDMRQRARRRAFAAVAVCLWACSILFLIVTPA